MNDNTDPPAAERWRALAADAYAVTERTTDPESKLTMRRIAQGYEQMAERAEQRDGHPSDIQAVIEPGPEPRTA